MARLRLSAMSAILLALLGAAVSPIFAQIVPGSAVAILVVDVFEQPASGEVNVPLEALEGMDCALSVAGQDGRIIDGGSGNQVVSSALHPLALPHGRLVYMHLVDLLDEQAFMSRGGAVTVLTADDTHVWNSALGSILLVPVDTQAYSIDGIVSSIQQAIAVLEGMDVTRIVVNMSFGVIPCADFPSLMVEDYARQLDEWGVTCSGDDDGFGAFVCDTLPELSNGDSGYLSSASVELLTSVRDQGGPLGAAFAILDLAVMRQKVAEALANATPEDVDPGSLGDFNGVIADLADSGLEIIQVASAGNETLDYPYFPGLHPDVLAVSADYSQMACPAGPPAALAAHLEGLGMDAAAAARVADGLINPTSNAGEVIEDGTTLISPARYLNNPTPDSDLLGCLNGTSFAAPRVSLDMAVHLLRGGTVSCTGALGTSQPPLAHDSWDDLTIIDAAAAYCADYALWN